MHDLDQVRLEASDPESIFEGDGLGANEGSIFSEGTLDEVEETELATQLLGVNSEEELDNFLGGFLKKARVFMKSPAGRMVTGLLKKAAKKALPMVGGAIGTYFGGPAGTSLGSSLASKAGQMFGLEVDGLSGEDQQLEVAKSIVRLANAAAQNVAASPLAQINPAAAAKNAVIEAAKAHAPGLLPAPARASGGRGGRWVRHGRQIVLYGI